MYFNKFPKLLYDLKRDGSVKVVTDIFRRIKVRSKIRDNISLMDKYDVAEGETPETIAFKVYGNPGYFYIICLMNNVLNRYYDWPLDEFAFQQFVKDKYDNPAGVHHYEKTQDSGKQVGEGAADYSHKIEVNSTEPGAEAVTNVEYERRLQDQKRQIRILPKPYVSAFEDEFNKLIRK